MKQIDRGVGFSELASLISETWGCTRRNARHVVSLAHKEWMEIAFGAEELDQRDLLFQSVARLERTARKAEEAGQFAVVVGCVAQRGYIAGKTDDGQTLIDVIATDPDTLNTVNIQVKTTRDGGQKWVMGVKNRVPCKGLWYVFVSIKDNHQLPDFYVF